MLAYFDCFSGISGDMTLGACIDLGVPLDWLKASLARLPLTDFSISVSPVVRHGISAKSVQVEAEEPHPHHDHHHHRHFTDIVQLIDQSPFSDSVKQKSIRIFDTLAAAEAQIHGCEKETVHFHEVGGIDAIVDIVGTVLCLEYLQIDTVIASKIPVGTGFVKCQHGVLPVPAPATAAILKGKPIYGSDVPFELVTPTGAAILVSLARSFGPLPDMTVQKIGYGAGARDIETRPNLLRIWLGEADPGTDRMGKEHAVVIEAAIDDMNPEIYSYLMDRLFAEGALDVCWIPLYMKKNRPGTMLQVLSPIHRKDALIQKILQETTTLGVRYHELHRRTLQREVVQVESRFGTVSVKKVKDLTGRIRWIPEYESCKAVALEKGLPLREVYEIIAGELGNRPE